MINPRFQKRAEKGLPSSISPSHHVSGTAPSNRPVRVGERNFFLPLHGKLSCPKRENSDLCPSVRDVVKTGVMEPARWVIPQARALIIVHSSSLDAFWFVLRSVGF